MKVYGIYIGDTYEGGDVKPTLYQEHDDARCDALKEVNKHQAEDDIIYGGLTDPELIPVKKWEEEDDDYWTNDITQIMVKSFDLK